MKPQVVHLGPVVPNPLLVRIDVKPATSLLSERSREGDERILREALIIDN